MNKLQKILKKDFLEHFMNKFFKKCNEARKTKKGVTE